MRNVVIASLFVVSLVACTRGESAPAGTPPPPPSGTLPSSPTAPTAAPPADPTPPPIAPRVPGPIGDALEAYEGVRAKLAGDDVAATAALTEKLAAAAKAAAAAAAAGPTQKPLADLAATAEKMKNIGATDIAAVRMAFGEVSRATVGLLVADPSLQTGRFLFLCPMAKGYQKWVQTTPKLQNPYWGKAMLDCGEELKKWEQ